MISLTLKGSRVLVTGGAGFIGSHIVEHLVKEGVDVIVYDNFSSGKLSNLGNLRKNIKIIKGDILDYSKLRDAVKGVDYVSHQAAQLEIFKCIEEPARDLEVNTIGTLNVLKASVAANVKKIVNASSACVYGQAQKIPEDEVHPKNPNWPYGVSKLAAEKYCEIFSHNYNIPIVNLRYGIVYGEREWFGRVLTIFLMRTILEKPLVIFGDGKQTRDFIHVADVAEAHNLCFEKDVRGPFNIGTGRGTKINHLAHIIDELTNSAAGIISEDVQEGEESNLIPGRRRIPSELRTMILDSTRARTELGWDPKVSLNEGLRRELKWITINPDEWETEGTIRV